MTRTPPRFARLRVLLLLALGVHPACRRAVPPGDGARETSARAAAGAWDPLAEARTSGGKGHNRESTVPPQCYTRTDGAANPCWTCHASGRGPHELDDSWLQASYGFSDYARDNHWSNLFVDRGAAIAAIADDEILRWVRDDNYRPLRESLHGRSGPGRELPLWAPDLDFDAGFDDDGFARDGSRWRALRYKPFPGPFWPTNGSTDDVLVRLPAEYHRDGQGRESRAMARLNYAILEAALSVVADAPPWDVGLDRAVEPVDERLAGFDLDGSGALDAAVARVRHLPRTYAGGAVAIAVRALLYPPGTEFLHTVRYLDPDRPSMIARRMKEVRYSRKVEDIDAWRRRRVYDEELEEKDHGMLPQFGGTPMTGLRNAFGWQLLGFIEDAQGRLRLQTLEEHRYCMGCHTNLGVTIDHTFAMPRKVPGAGGFRYQDLAGILDVPQAGHADPEVLTYLRRVTGGDEFRANDEILERFFPRATGGRLDEAEVRRAAPGGDRDLRHLVAPSRARALLLDKAYLALVRAQDFAAGRDTVIAPPGNVHRRIDDESTGLAAAGRLAHDGRLQLQWEPAHTPARPDAAAPRARR